MAFQLVLFFPFFPLKTTRIITLQTFLGVEDAKGASVRDKRHENRMAKMIHESGRRQKCRKGSLQSPLCTPPSEHGPTYLNRTGSDTGLSGDPPPPTWFQGHFCTQNTCRSSCKVPIIVVQF
jgi:hypothetical protein